MVNLVEKARIGRMAALETKTRGASAHLTSPSRQNVTFISRRSNPAGNAGWQL
jgi:hypothetical protein